MIMPKPVVIMGMTHDTCRWCGGVFKMRDDRRLYHHGPPARRCAGANEYGREVYEFMTPYFKRQLDAQLRELEGREGPMIPRLKEAILTIRYPDSTPTEAEIDADVQWER